MTAKWPKFRLCRRSSRASGTCQAKDCSAGARESLGSKNRDEAENLLRATNESHAQPILSRELGKVYVEAQEPQFGYLITFPHKLRENRAPQSLPVTNPREEWLRRLVSRWRNS